MGILDPQELLMEDLNEHPLPESPHDRIMRFIYEAGFNEGSVKTGNDAPYKRKDYRRIWLQGYAAGSGNEEAEKYQLLIGC